MSTDNATAPGGPMSGLVASAVEYMLDAGQRSVLFLDVMRRRGDQYREHIAQTAPHVLQYAAELIVDGRMLEQPVNYALVRIIPPKDVEIDLNRRPFIVAVTKIDKLKSQREKHRSQASLRDGFAGELLECSGLTGRGVREIWQAISKIQK